MDRGDASPKCRPEDVRAELLREAERQAYLPPERRTITPAMADEIADAVAKRQLEDAYRISEAS